MQFELSCLLDIFSSLAFAFALFAYAPTSQAVVVCQFVRVLRLLISPRNSELARPLFTASLSLSLFISLRIALSLPPSRSGPLLFSPFVNSAVDNRPPNAKTPHPLISSTRNQKLCDMSRHLIFFYLISISFHFIFHFTSHHLTTSSSVAVRRVGCVIVFRCILT